MTIDRVLNALLTNGGNKTKTANDILHAMRVHCIMQISQQNTEIYKEKLKAYFPEAKKVAAKTENVAAKTEKEEDLQMMLAYLLNNVTAIQLTAQQKADKYRQIVQSLVNSISLL